MQSQQAAAASQHGAAQQTRPALAHLVPSDLCGLHLSPLQSPTITFPTTPPRLPGPPAHLGSANPTAIAACPLL